MGFSSASAGAEVEVVVVARGRSTPFVDLSLSYNDTGMIKVTEINYYKYYYFDNGV